MDISSENNIGGSGHTENIRIYILNTVIVIVDTKLHKHQVKLVRYFNTIGRHGYNLRNLS